jgi:uncharacterized membrane protein YjfL (UPF0719 family)
LTDNSQGAREQWNLARAVGVGAGLGVLNVVFNIFWGALTSRDPINVREQVTFGAVSAVGGAIIAFVLYFTKSFRKRGMVQHYLCWMLASVVAALVLVVPGMVSEGWSRSLAFALWLGVSAGLGLGAFARQVERRSTDESARTAV